MTKDLRDEIALEAMKIILAEEARRSMKEAPVNADIMARQAYLIADVMLRTREEGRPPKPAIPVPRPPQPSGGEKRAP